MIEEVDPYLGQVLDDKYRLESLLGRGGMGAVYLATHLGTERYVALKLITPQFMRNEEFVARFKREARAAGRLRHPNVVDVTDFGFARAGKEPVAYLVMEYLDGCTLGDVLAEEERLPLEWVVDILEQVSSAVHEAHQQGIIHRDLKPENIWLEPNRLGGYRVKVLDFGIAKLAEGDRGDTVEAPQQTEVTTNPSGEQKSSSPKPTPTSKDLEVETLIYDSEPEVEPATLIGGHKLTPDLRMMADEAGTQLFENSGKTSAMSAAETDHTDDDDGTLILEERETANHGATNLAANTTRASELTRVGAIMGTPLYMSPEQCAAKKLDARSDIYSLGVIAYQMLAGEPPFSGKTVNVMRNHIDTPPPSLRERAGKVPKRAAKVVMSALAKDPTERPQTAAAFASELRAQAEGIGSLYRRAVALYSEYFPKFLKLSLIAHIPVIISTFLLIGLELLGDNLPKGMSATKVAYIVAIALVGLLQIASHFVAAAAMSGMTAVIVTQVTAAPLRPVELRTAFAVLRRRWKPFLNTAVRVTLRIVIGFILLIIPGLVMTIRYALYAPVVLIEGLEKKAALARARQLASRSWRTVIIVTVLQLVIPMTVSMLLGRLTIKAGGTPTPSTGVRMSSSIYQQLTGLLNIFIVPLMSIVPALLYLKMRQLGGEGLSEALVQIEEVDEKHSEWQKRMRTRLSLHTPRSTRRDGSHQSFNSK
ncbi:MAG TPA: serine/threonine-protein kinase [Pyrinomonadaceae bacterium]|nr:serine/threonine-protein kinase [Pyrinomonadaceae bacterium]